MHKRHYTSAGASIDYGDAVELFPVEALEATVLQGRDAQLALGEVDGEDVVGTVYRAFAVRYPGEPTDTVTSRSLADRRLKSDTVPADSALRTRLETAAVNDCLDAVRRAGFRLGYELTFECRDGRLSLWVWDDDRLKTLADSDGDLFGVGGPTEVVIIVAHETSGSEPGSLQRTLVRALERTYETDATTEPTDGRSGCRS